MYFKYSNTIKKQKCVLVVLAVLVVISNVLLEECLEGSGDDQHLAARSKAFDWRRNATSYHVVATELDLNWIAISCTAGPAVLPIPVVQAVYIDKHLAK